MSLNQLSILKSRLTELNQTVNTCRKELLSWLQKQEKIPAEDEEDIVVEKSTWAAALKALFVLQGFVSDLDDQFACEMCAILAKIGC